MEQDMEQSLFPRTPFERLLSLKKFLEAEHGHRVHMLAQAEEDDRIMRSSAATDIQRAKAGRRLIYWKQSVMKCNSCIDDVETLLAEMR